MTLRNFLRAQPASKSRRILLEVDVMLSPCSAKLFCVWALLLCHNAWNVASLKGGKELDNTIIRTVGGEKAADVWVPRFIFNHKKICAGVTLTAEADLTSATCLNDDEPLEAFVVVESRGQNEPPVQVAHIDRCVKFDEGEQHEHDLMVCFHHCQWNFSDYIFVPRINLEADVVPSEFDETCSVMGFGHMTAEGDKCNVLHTMDIHVGTSRDCGSQDSVQNYVCGAATGQQESCLVDGGEPLLCKHGSSEFLIHGICKQGDCSAPQKHSKFLLLSYYRDWLKRTVPGLALSAVPEKDGSSQREEWKLQDVAPEQNHQKTDRAEDKAEKCPTLAHPPPVHIHNRVIAKEEHSGRVTSANSKENISSSVRTISHSGDEERSPSPARDVHNPTGKQSESRNSDPVNTTFRDVPDGVPRATTPAQLPSGDPALVPTQNSADNVSNVTVLLESLADGWYLSNATQSVPQLSGNKETLDLDRLEKVISENGDVLKFSYIVDTTNFSLPGYRSKSVEPVAKLHSSAGKEFGKSGAYSPKSILSNEIKPAGHKSLDGVRKSGPIAVDTGRTSNIKPQNLLPSGVKTPIPEAHRDRVPVSESSQDAANSSVVPPQNLSAEVPGVPPKPRPAAPSTLTLDPSQWEWLTKNALRIPKNPLQNPKILGKTLLFKQPKPKYDSSSRERLAEEYWLRGGKQASENSEESGFPRTYREKWAAQDMSYSHVRFPRDSVIMRIDPVHRPSKGAPKTGVHMKTARPTSSALHVPPSGSRDEPNGVSPQRSLANGETHSGGADVHSADTRIPRNAFARPDLSTDERRARSAPASPTLTAETGERRASSSPSANGRRPEGTFFGVLSSSVRARLKREGAYDANTLLADLASWPSRAGLMPSELTPPVSFLTAVNQSYTNPLIPPSQSFYLYFKILRAFLPGGNVARRLDMYKKQLVWGPPITYDEFAPFAPRRNNMSTPEVEEPLPPPPDEEEEEEATEGEGTGVSGVTSSSVPPVETESSHHATTNQDAAQQAGGAPSPISRLRRDVDTIGTELGAENESRPAGDSDTNYSGSPDGANISDQPDSGISVGSFGAGKATTPATIDTRHQTALNTDGTPQEAAVDSAGTQKGGSLHTADDSVLSTVKHEESTLSTSEATVPTADVRKVSTVAGEATQSTMNTRRETEQLAGDNYSTSLAGDDGEGDAARMPDIGEDRNREQTDFYAKIRRLGTDDGTNAAQKAISIFGVVHTLMLVWILLPQV